LSEQFKKKTLIHVLSSHKQLQYYLEAHPKAEELMKTILRTYGGVFEALTEINLQAVKSKMGMEIKDALNLLDLLKREGMIDFEHDAHDASVTFLVPREDDVTINRLAPYIKQQTQTKTSKVEAVLAYVKKEDKCRSQQLLEYFGEKTAAPCGICSVCTRPAEVLTQAMAKEIYSRIVGVLETGPHSSRQLVEKLLYPEAHVLKVLQLLVERGALASPAPNVYKLKHL